MVNTMSATEELFIIDTDGGSDDAMAIILALIKRPSQVLAFTCCFGNANVDQVSQNVMRVMVLCNQKQIPVFRGSYGPLMQRKKAPVVHGEDGFGNCAKEFPTGGLVEESEPASFALIDLTKKYPGRITLIVLGPMTNLAVAHRIDPDFSKRLKSIVSMGGNYKGVGNVTETAEFNFYCDPEAAHIILTESLCPLTLVPWETTEKYGMEWVDFEKLLSKQTKAAHFVSRTSSVTVDFCRQNGDPLYEDCDFMAMAAALYPESIQSSIKRAIRVECRGEFTTGLCICTVPSSATTGRKTVDIVESFNRHLLMNLREEIYNYNHN